MSKVQICFKLFSKENDNLASVCMELYKTEHISVHFGYAYYHKLAQNWQAKVTWDGLT